VLGATLLPELTYLIGNQLSLLVLRARRTTVSVVESTMRLPPVIVRMNMSMAVIDIQFRKLPLHAPEHVRPAPAAPLVLNWLEEYA
jgi:hypothetical protein